MKVIELEIVTDFKEIHSWNAPWSMEMTESGIVTDSNDPQKLNDWAEMKVIKSGMTIDFSLVR